MLPNSIVLNQIEPHIKIAVRKSNKAKHCSIRIKAGEVELVLPNNDFKTGYAFLLKKEHWIRKKLKNYKIISIDHTTLPIFGELYALQYIEATYDEILIENEMIKIHSPINTANKSLIQFLQSKLLLEITNLVEILNNKQTFSFTKIRIVNSKSRWGSCCTRGVLSFNWRLALVPKEILHYVVVHEMCHLLEMNHSKRFWNHVSTFCPDYKSHKTWLKENSARLHQYL